MSAPRTNIERQKQRHRGPLIGIILGLAVVAVLFFVFLGDSVTPEAELLDEGATAPLQTTPAPETTAPAPVTPETATPEPAAPAGN